MLEILGKLCLAGYKELTPSEIDLLKNYLFEKDLDIDNIELTKLDLEITTHILNKFEEKNEAFETTWINEYQLKKDLRISNNEFNSFINKLKNNGLKYSLAMGDGTSFKLDYSLFWKTNYWERTECNLYFIDLLISFTKELIENYDLLDNYIDITQFIKFDTNEQNYSYLQINSVLFYYEQQGLIKDKNCRGDMKFVFREFLIHKHKLEELKRKLNIKNNMN